MKYRLLIVALLLLPLVLQAADSTPAQNSREMALSRLLEGNARYTAAVPASGNTGAGARPVACIVTCSDARVAPEIVFDQALGSLYVVRNLGCVPGIDVQRSVEYAVTQLHVPVVFVLGHSDCAAAIAAPRHSAPEAPIHTASHSPGASESPAQSAESNARMTAMSLLDGSPAIAAAVARHETALIAGFLDLTTGKARFDTELASVALPEVHAAVEAAPAAPAKPALATAKPEAPAKTAVTVANSPAHAAPAAAPAAADSTVKPMHKALLNSASFTRRTR